MRDGDNGPLLPEAGLQVRERRRQVRGVLADGGPRPLDQDGAEMG